MKMKTIITALLVAMCALAQGQSDTIETPADTSYLSAKVTELYFEVGLVQSQVDDLNAKLDGVNLKLASHREEFKEGLNYQFVGALFFTMGMLVTDNGQWANAPGRTVGYAIMGLGGIMFTAGVAVIIDSDKWLK